MNLDVPSRFSGTYFPFESKLVSYDVKTATRSLMYADREEFIFTRRLSG